MTGNLLRVSASGELVHLLDRGKLAEATSQIVCTGELQQFTYLIAGNLVRLPIKSSDSRELVYLLDSGELAEATYQVIG